MNNKSLRGSLLLLLGAVIWGVAFVAQRMGMDSMPPLAFNGIRMLLAGIALLPVIAFADRKEPARKPVTAEQKKDLRIAGLLCGTLLFISSSLQQMGLVYTSAGKAGFITALYVVLVPVISWTVFRKNPGRVIWLSVALAVAGLYLLCAPAGGEALNRGDLLVLGCALCFTGHIMVVDHYAPRVDGIRLSCIQFFICGILSMMLSLPTETITWEGIRGAVIPILYAGIMSGAVGYTLQIIGQRDVNPTVASLLMCLESVFAVLTGAVVLGERMTAGEGIGSVLMLCAVVLAQLSPILSRKLKKA